MSVLSTIKKPIEQELAQFEEKFFASVKSDVPLLNLILKYYLRSKGKQLRPVFVFLAAKMIGNTTKATFTAAVLVELMHTATLVHDDVVDDSHTRRGLFTINALWKNKIAVLIGDFFLAKGLLHAIEAKEYRLLEILSNAVREMSEGELMQIEKARKLDITEDTYFEIIKKKTATLVGASIASGFASAGCSEEIQQKGYQLGEYIGIAFQIRDDLLDYESSTVIGKPSGNDIRERKMTLPLIYALKAMDTSEKKAVLSIFKKKNKRQSDVDKVYAAVKKHKGIEYAQEIMNQYSQYAIDSLAVFPENETKESFKMLISYISQRKK
jgi:octaprenyl-diphosphate synthase